MDEKETKLRTEYEQLNESILRPDAYSDPEIGTKTRRHGELKQILDLLDEIREKTTELSETKKLVNGTDKDMSELAQDEVTKLEKRLSAINARLELLLVPKDPNDDKDIIIEIRAGAGGDEASLFAGELYRMYI